MDVSTAKVKLSAEAAVPSSALPKAHEFALLSTEGASNSHVMAIGALVMQAIGRRCAHPQARAKAMIAMTASLEAARILEAHERRVCAGGGHG